MPKATQENNGALIPLNKCYIIVPGGNGNAQINLDNLPDISDSKSSEYQDESIIGRSSPMKTWGYSNNRAISMTIHLIVSKQGDVQKNLGILRLIESCTYPKDGDSGAPYYPPPICRLKCGSLLADKELCVVLKNYNVKFPTEVAWDEDTFIPFKFDIETSWEVVYASKDLPGQQRIASFGK